MDIKRSISQSSPTSPTNWSSRLPSAPPPTSQKNKSTIHYQRSDSKLQIFNRSLHDDNPPHSNWIEPPITTECWISFQLFRKYKLLSQGIYWFVEIRYRESLAFIWPLKLLVYKMIRIERLKTWICECTVSIVNTCIIHALHEYICTHYLFSAFSIGRTNLLHISFFSVFNPCLKTQMRKHKSKSSLEKTNRKYICRQGKV